MFNFLSKSTLPNHLFTTLKADMHSHLLPGIDDGAQDIATSLELIRGMSNAGYSKLITTPHIMWDMYQNTRDTILYNLEEVREALRDQQLDIELHAAAEYFLDDHVMGLLKNREPLLTLANNLVLTEFSMANQPIDLKEILFEMRMRDYQPVIAHPERYIYLEDNKEFFDELKDAGYLFQLNVLSFIGMYGKTVKDLAHYLGKKGYYDFVGTDLHNHRHLKALKDFGITEPLNKLLETGNIQNNLL